MCAVNILTELSCDSESANCLGGLLDYENPCFYAPADGKQLLARSAEKYGQPDHLVTSQDPVDILLGVMIQLCQHHWYVVGFDRSYFLCPAGYDRRGYDWPSLGYYLEWKWLRRGRMWGPVRNPQAAQEMCCWWLRGSVEALSLEKAAGRHEHCEAA